MPGIGQDDPVLHEIEVLASQNVQVARYGHEDVADPGRLGGGHHPVAVHGGR